MAIIKAPSNANPALHLKALDNSKQRLHEPGAETDLRNDLLPELLKGMASTDTPTDLGCSTIATATSKGGTVEALHLERIGGGSGEAKRAQDGKTILIPQPSDDPDDPLNWSWGKKHRVLAAVSLGALLADWGTAWGTTLFEVQAVTWKSSVGHAANSIGGAVFLTGASGLLVSPLTQRYGR